MKLNEFKNKIFALVSNDDMKKALELLTREVENTSSHYRLIITLSGQMSSLEKSKISAGFSPELIRQMTDRIRDDLLNLMELLGEDDMKGWEGQVMVTEQTKDHEGVSVFFSVATPYNDEQKTFLDYFKTKFESCGLSLETPMWSAENALLPIREKMKQVSGCVVLALERMLSVENIYKPGTPKELKAKEECFTTPWIQMEAAMAYQQELPIIIFSEKKLKNEGMIEMGVHEFRIFDVDISNPKQLDEDFYENLIRYWADKVKRHKEKTHSKI